MKRRRGLFMFLRRSLLAHPPFVNLPPCCQCTNGVFLLCASHPSVLPCVSQVGFEVCGAFWGVDQGGGSQRIRRCVQHPFATKAPKFLNSHFWFWLVWLSFIYHYFHFVVFYSDEFAPLCSPNECLDGAGEIRRIPVVLPTVQSGVLFHSNVLPIDFET